MRNIIHFYPGHGMRFVLCVGAKSVQGVMCVERGRAQISPHELEVVRSRFASVFGDSQEFLRGLYELEAYFAVLRG